MIEIEKGIPIPERRYSSGKPYKYPYQEMEVGESFWHEAPSTPHSVARLSAYQWSAKYNKGWKFVAQQEDKKGVRGFRVWRTK